MRSNSLLRHPFWDATDPTGIRLVRVSREFPREFNPFHRDGVILKAAGIPGEAQHSKWIVAREGILDGIKNGRIYPGMKGIDEATSGNTGVAMALVCNALDLPFTAVMSSDVPPDKLDAIRVVSRRTRIELHLSATESTVEYARRLGNEDGMYNPDQYAKSWNPDAQYKYLAPQLWEQQPKIKLLFVPGGTLGSSIGLERYARDRGFGTIVVPVLCAEGEEVPGARTASSVKRDVLQPVFQVFREENLEYGKRHAAFLLSFLSWSYTVPPLGPSFGLGMAGAFRFLLKCRQDKVLDQFRDGDGKIHVVVVGPDDCRSYLPLYFGQLKKWELESRELPADLQALLDK